MKPHLLFLVVLTLGTTGSLHANPFPLMTGHTLLYHTDFSSDSNWNLTANAFVSHAQNPSFRPPTGGTIAANLLSLGMNGSAVLDLTSPSVLGQSLTVGSGTAFAVYGRVSLNTTSANASVIFSFGNDEAFAVSPNSANVVVASGYVRRLTSNSKLGSWGWKHDFNNPYDLPYLGEQNTTMSDMPTNSTEFDVAFLFNGAEITAFTKSTASGTWNSLGVAAVPNGAPVFDSSKLVLYNPNNGSATVSHLTLSAIPEAETTALVLLGFLMLVRFRRVHRLQP